MMMMEEASAVVVPVDPSTRSRSRSGSTKKDKDKDKESSWLAASGARLQRLQSLLERAETLLDTEDSVANFTGRIVAEGNDSVGSLSHGIFCLAVHMTDAADALLDDMEARLFAGPAPEAVHEDMFSFVALLGEALVLDSQSLSAELSASKSRHSCAATCQHSVPLAHREGHRATADMQRGTLLPSSSLYEACVATHTMLSTGATGQLSAALKLDPQRITFATAFLIHYGLLDTAALEPLFLQENTHTQQDLFSQLFLGIVVNRAITPEQGADFVCSLLGRTSRDENDPSAKRLAQDAILDVFWQMATLFPTALTHARRVAAGSVSPLPAQILVNFALKSLPSEPAAFTSLYTHPRAFDHITRWVRQTKGKDRVWVQLQNHAVETFCALASQQGTTMISRDANEHCTKTITALYTVAAVFSDPTLPMQKNLASRVSSAVMSMLDGGDASTSGGDAALNVQAEVQAAVRRDLQRCTAVIVFTLVAGAFTMRKNDASAPQGGRRASSGTDASAERVQAFSANTCLQAALTKALALLAEREVLQHGIVSGNDTESAPSTVNAQIADENSQNAVLRELRQSTNALWAEYQLLALLLLHAHNHGQDTLSRASSREGSAEGNGVSEGGGAEGKKASDWHQCIAKAMAWHTSPVMSSTRSCLSHDVLYRMVSSAVSAHVADTARRAISPALPILLAAVCNTSIPSFARESGEKGDALQHWVWTASVKPILSSIQNRDFTQQAIDPSPWVLQLMKSYPQQSAVTSASARLVKLCALLCVEPLGDQRENFAFPSETLEQQSGSLVQLLRQGEYGQISHHRALILAVNNLSPVPNEQESRDPSSYSSPNNDNTDAKDRAPAAHSLPPLQIHDHPMLLKDALLGVAQTKGIYGFKPLPVNQLLQVDHSRGIGSWTLKLVYVCSFTAFQRLRQLRTKPAFNLRGRSSTTTTNSSTTNSSSSTLSSGTSVGVTETHDVYRGLLDQIVDFRSYQNRARRAQDALHADVRELVAELLIVHCPHMVGHLTPFESIIAPPRYVVRGTRAPKPLPAPEALLFLSSLRPVEVVYEDIDTFRHALQSIAATDAHDTKKNRARLHSCCRHVYEAFSTLNDAFPGELWGDVVDFLSSNSLWGIQEASNSRDGLKPHSQRVVQPASAPVATLSLAAILKQPHLVVERTLPAALTHPFCVKLCTDLCNEAVEAAHLRVRADSQAALAHAHTQVRRQVQEIAQGHIQQKQQQQQMQQQMQLLAASKRPSADGDGERKKVGTSQNGTARSATLQQPPPVVGLSVEELTAYEKRFREGALRRLESLRATISRTIRIAVVSACVQKIEEAGSLPPDNVGLSPLSCFHALIEGTLFGENAPSDEGLAKGQFGWVHGCHGRSTAVLAPNDAVVADTLMHIMSLGISPSALGSLIPSIPRLSVCEHYLPQLFEQSDPEIVAHALWFHGILCSVFPSAANLHLALRAVSLFGELYAAIDSRAVPLSQAAAARLRLPRKRSDLAGLPLCDKLFALQEQMNAATPRSRDRAALDDVAQVWLLHCLPSALLVCHAFPTLIPTYLDALASIQKSVHVSSAEGLEHGTPITSCLARALSQCIAFLANTLLTLHSSKVG